ncbi:PREDICTED: uncharacterized protein LOC108361567 [Rhagoletis zephyria]|uniref:uncharacterized protein LOC108361567 n=1 Tax=Rhagoletis zephyria TaxID=28612 RepID=UPI0008119009|nr:PREDICTED: uncharacterized protein LOC108361567 [Rhagoletis zephyria]
MEYGVIDAEKYSLLQLKAWCTAVGINASGAKASLAARLSDLSAEARGLCPGTRGASSGKDVDESDDADDVSDVDDEGSGLRLPQRREKVEVRNKGQGSSRNEGENNVADNGNGSRPQSRDNGATNGEDDGENNGRGNKTQRRGKSAVRNVVINDDEDAVCVRSGVVCVRSGNFGACPKKSTANEVSENNGAPSQSTTSDNNKNAEAAAVEAKLLEKEIQLLKLQKALLEKDNAMASVEKSGGYVSFETLKDIIAVYDGGDGFNIWYNQLMHYREVLKIDDAILGVAIHLKLKGAALAWYNAKVTIPKNVDELLRDMKSVFASGQSVLVRRRKFEKRTWSHEESFANYFNEKCMLGSDLNLKDEELADYLIEGIPDRQLQNQARLQNFTSANDVVKAFRSISLPDRPPAKVRTDQRMRCYNCNCTGHYAKDCKKPKREAGSCYACGEQGHYAVDCNKYKKPKNTFNV